MTVHADILDQRDSLKGALLGALAIHVGVAVAIGVGNLRDNVSFGAPDAGGGAIGIEVAKSIPLQHKGMENPVANDTQSQVPQTPVKDRERTEKKQKESPDAVKLRDKNKRKQTPEPAAKQRFRPFDKLEPNQLTSTTAPQISNPIYSAMPGAGRIGTGANTTLGNRFPAYAEQIQRLIAQKWRTSDVDANLKTAPIVIATFDLLRNGSVRNLQLLQTSGIPTLDLSVQRAILEASPFPPIPVGGGFDKDSAKVEFWFELKR